MPLARFLAGVLVSATMLAGCAPAVSGPGDPGPKAKSFVAAEEREHQRLVGERAALLVEVETAAERKATRETVLALQDARWVLDELLAKNPAPSPEQIEWHFRRSVGYAAGPTRVTVGVGPAGQCIKRVSEFDPSVQLVWDSTQRAIRFAEDTSPGGACAGKAAKSVRVGHDDPGDN